MTTGEGPGASSIPPSALPGDAAGLLGIQPLLEHDPPEIGPYTLVGRLGKGGTGVAFLAKSPEGQWVVVKAIWPHLAEDAEQIARTFREAEALKAISSPRTSRLLDTSAAGPRPWFAMEYVPGVNLKDYVESQGPLDPIQLVAFADGLASAIADVHAAGVVHRDIKPANTIMTPSGPRIIDFGVAHLSDATVVTVSGAAVGTPAWMAPEQLARESVSPATDVHAWALNVIYAGSGKEPLLGATYTETAANIVWSHPDVPDAFPTSLRSVLTGALAKDPRSRPTIADIHAAIAAGGTSLVIVDDEDLPARAPRRLLMPLAVAAGVLAALFIAVPVLALILARSGEASGTAASPAAEMEVSESGGLALEGLTASATPNPVSVGEPFAITALTAPSMPEVAVRVEQLVRASDGAQWQSVAETVTDSEGRAEWTSPGVDEAGPKVYRVVSDIADGSMVTSPTISVSIARISTALVDVKWPGKPAGHCQAQVIPVTISPVETGRTVLLQYTRNERSWKTATEATVDARGKARLRTPGCDSPAGQKRDEFTWRALAPESSRYAERASSSSRLVMCPGPAPVYVTSSIYSDGGQATIQVSNPSEQCSAAVRVTAMISCGYGSGQGSKSKSLGYREASFPGLLEPSGARTVENWDLFSGAYSECQAWQSGSGLFSNSVGANAVEFVPPA
jgi:hypothetical protein